MFYLARICPELGVCAVVLRDSRLATTDAFVTFCCRGLGAAGVQGGNAGLGGALKSSLGRKGGSRASSRPCRGRGERRRNGNGRLGNFIGVSF